MILVLFMSSPSPTSSPQITGIFPLGLRLLTVHNEGIYLPPSSPLCTPDTMHLVLLCDDNDYCDACLCGCFELVHLVSHTHTHAHNYASVEEGLHQISAKEVQSAVDKSYQASLLSLQQWAAAAT